MIRQMRFYSNFHLVSLLDDADLEELHPIFEQVEMPVQKSYPKHFLVKRISELGGNALTNMLRVGEATGYLDILIQIATLFGITNQKTQWKLICKRDDSAGSLGRLASDEQIAEIARTVVEIEDQILQHVAEQLYRRLTPEQKLGIDLQLKELARTALGNPRVIAAGAGGLLMLGSLGGFATYTLLSSLLHAVSFGTLSFGAYTAASSALSVFLGPVGWAVLGAYSLFALGSPRQKKLVPVVLTIALIRRKHSEL